MTLMDSIDNFLATYIRRSDKKEQPPEKVEDTLPFEEGDVDESKEKFSMKINGKKLTPELRRRMALTAPFYMKGLRKKCRDTFRAGWTYKKYDTKKTPPKIEMDVIERFNKRNNIYEFMTLMKQDAHVYGDGMALILFINDQGKKNPDLSRAPKETAEPFKLKRLDPERVFKFEYKNKYWKNKGIMHLVYEKKGFGFSDDKKIYIHPDRVLMFQETKFAFSKLGISDIDILRHIINSTADVDIATGDILRWFSYGIVEWTKEGADQNAMGQMRKIAEKHPHTFLGNEKYELKVHNPEAIDPEPFYDYIIMAIAATLVMPTHVLKGVEIGKVTGAEVGYADYHKDIKDSQVLVYKPQLERLYSMLFKAVFTDDEGIQKRKFDYDIEFNEIYVGEMAEAEVDAKRAATAVNLKGSNIIDLEESRKYMNEGHIYLEQDKEIKNEDNEEKKEPIKPNPRTELPARRKEKEDKSDDNKLKSTDETMSDFWKDKGKREELLQEKRTRQAKIEKLKAMKERIKEIKNAES